ncbi:hypothetical protein AV656_08080 [Bhargavaea cecembensis]|uniref:Uncharacterized protein n=1 Tax=Bhargavaea cecembensis TaxID=394098 RepID=A0A161ST86_9BACL|nr:hypothetical protein [Bhargavaea cecembensis]KZE38850.1 hypothetical protein AV656_08080 [Bhargavaea cecembensis]
MNKKVVIKKKGQKAVVSPKVNGSQVIAFTSDGNEKVGQVIIKRTADYSKPDFLEDEDFWRKKIQGLRAKHIH